MPETYPPVVPLPEGKWRNVAQPSHQPHCHFLPIVNAKRGPMHLCAGYPIANTELGSRGQLNGESSNRWSTSMGPPGSSIFNARQQQITWTEVRVSVLEATRKYWSMSLNFLGSTCSFNFL